MAESKENEKCFVNVDRTALCASHAKTVLTDSVIIKYQAYSGGFVCQIVSVANF